MVGMLVCTGGWWVVLLLKDVIAVELTGCSMHNLFINTLQDNLIAVSLYTKWYMVFLLVDFDF